MTLGKSATIGVSAIALSLGLAYSAEATVLPVQNLGFNVLAHPLTQAKDFFTVVQPTGWSIGTVAQQDNLIYVGQQGSEGFSDQSHGNIYGVYTNPGFSNTVPPGTNFYQADGNPAFESTILQTIAGLTANTVYTLQFQQAAGQQIGFTGDTTEQWRVFLGTGGVQVNCGPNPCVVTATNNVEADSPLMNTPSGHNTDWNNVNLTFPALPAGDLLPGGNAVLTFLAWGDGGSTTNLPPTVFLEGVNTPPTVPEPASLSLLGVALLGLWGIALRCRAKHDAAV